MGVAGKILALAGGNNGTGGMTVEVVTELPESGTSGVLYMVPKVGGTAPDVYDEYVWVNEAWEQIGSTQIDLTDYLKTADHNSDLTALTFTDSAGTQTTVYVHQSV